MLLAQWRSTLEKAIAQLCFKLKKQNDSEQKKI